MDVITDILDIAKAQSGTIELQKRTVRPEAVMRAAVRIVHEKARDANVTLVTQIEEHLPTVEADTVRLRQILLNLLSNAIKFTSAGGTINADVCRHPEGVALRVSDSGSGMAPGDIPRALQPFIQVDTSLARRHGGTGLGLPLTKIFVELHGGRLEIDSTINVGTTVTVILPASAGATPLSDVPPGLPRRKPLWRSPRRCPRCSCRPGNAATRGMHRPIRRLKARRLMRRLGPWPGIAMAVLICAAAGLPGRMLPALAWASPWPPPWAPRWPAPGWADQFAEFVGAAAFGAARVHSAAGRSGFGGTKAALRTSEGVPFPNDNPWSEAKEKLGRMLFFDPILSAATPSPVPHAITPAFPGPTTKSWRAVPGG